MQFDRATLVSRGPLQTRKKLSPFSSIDSIEARVIFCTPTLWCVLVPGLILRKSEIEDSVS